MFLWLLLHGGASRTSESEYILHTFQSNKKVKESSLDFQSRQFGIVTDYSSDDKSQTEFYKLCVLGDNIRRMIPHVDRILLIPTNFYVSTANYHHLLSTWNIILRLDYPYLECESINEKQEFNHFWFRFKAQMLTMYNKLLYIDHNTYFINSPEVIFSYPTPSSAIDYQSWGITYFGVAHNYGFFLFKPSMTNYYKLLNQTCYWNDYPFLSHQKYTNQSTVSIGPYDNGILHEILGISTYTMPPYVNVETGPEAFKNKYRFTDPRIISFRFLEIKPPWIGNSYADIYWKVIAEQAFDKLGLNFPYKIKEKPEEEQSRNEIKKRLNFVQYPIYKVVKCNNDLVSFSTVIVIAKSICILFFGLLIIRFLSTYDFDDIYYF